MRDDRVNSEHADIANEQRRSRRSFLKSTAATGGAAAVLTGSSLALGANKSLPTLPYQTNPNWVKFHFQNIINNEVSHLSTLLKQLGPLARPKPTFQNLAVTNITQYIEMGSLFCSTGAGAYLGATPYITDSFLMNEAGSIGQVELTQSGYLNTLLGGTFLPGGSPFALTLTLPEVLQRAAPYIANLNGGPSPIFSTTDLSHDNDIAIVNVALILEYLEVEFYTANFYTIFPS